MVVYFGNLALTVFLAWLAVYKAPVEENIIGKEYKKPRPFLFFLSIASLVLFFAFKGKSGVDSAAYISWFNRMRYASFLGVLKMEQPIFNLICWLDYRVFSGNVVLHNIVIGILIYLPIIYVYSRHTHNYAMAILLYILTTAYYTAFNAQRQFLAVGVCMMGYESLLKKKYLRYILFVLIASWIHSTAVFMLPITFLANRKTTSWFFIISVVVMIIGSIFLLNYWFEICQFLVFIGQERIVSYYMYGLQYFKSVNVFRILAALASVALGLVLYKRLSKNNSDFDLILNLNIIGFAFVFAGINGVIFIRLSQYTMQFTPMLLMKISTAFDKRGKIVYYSFVVVLYFIYVIVSLKREHGLLPYDFANGIRLFFGKKAI